MYWRQDFAGGKGRKPTDGLVPACFTFAPKAGLTRYAPANGIESEANPMGAMNPVTAYLAASRDTGMTNDGTIYGVT